MNEVLFVANSSQATPTGGGRTRIISEARQLRKHGFTVRILCFFPPHHIVTRFVLLATGRSKLSRESNCEVYYVPRFPMTRISWIDWLNTWYGGLCILLFSLYFRIRIVHGHGHKATLFGLYAKRIKKGLCVVSDFHGATMEEYLYEREAASFDQLAEKIRKEERFILRQANRLILVSEGMRRYFQEREGLDLDQAVVVPCATDASLMISDGRRETLRRDHKLGDSIVFCYVGSGEAYQLPETMCELFREMLTLFPNAFFLILSHHGDVFHKHLQAAGIEQRFYKVTGVEHSKVFDWLQMADVGLLLRKESAVNRVASPTKFAEYCLCGVPVIITEGVGDFSQLAEKYQIGHIIDPLHDFVDDSLVAFVSEVQERRSEYATRCHAFAREHLSWEVYGDVLRRIYSSLSGANCSAGNP